MSRESCEKFLENYEVGPWLVGYAKLVTPKSAKEYILDTVWSSSYQTIYTVVAIFPNNKIGFAHNTDFSIGKRIRLFDYENNGHSDATYEVVEFCEDDRILWVEKVK